MTKDRRSIDVGTRVDAGGDVKAGPPAESETPTATADTEGAEDPSQRVQEMATRSEEEASSLETTGAKDAVEQGTQTREERCKKAEAAKPA